jgi:hypothetical protein
MLTEKLLLKNPKFILQMPNPFFNRKPQYNNYQGGGGNNSSFNPRGGGGGNYEDCGDNMMMSDGSQPRQFGGF